MMSNIRRIGGLVHDDSEMRLKVETGWLSVKGKDPACAEGSEIWNDNPNSQDSTYLQGHREISTVL